MYCHLGFVVLFKEHRKSRFRTILRTLEFSKWQMSTGFNFKVPAALDPTENQPVFSHFEARHWLLLYNCESPRWRLLLTEVCFISTEYPFSAATYTHDLSWLWVTCRGFHISTCCSPCTFVSEPTSAGFWLFFCSFLTSRLSQNWRD